MEQRKGCRAGGAESGEGLEVHCSLSKYMADLQAKKLHRCLGGGGRTGRELVALST